MENSPHLKTSNKTRDQLAKEAGIGEETHYRSGKYLPDSIKNKGRANLPKLETREILAKEAGVSARTLNKVSKIEAEGSEDLQHNNASLSLPQFRGQTLLKMGAKQSDFLRMTKLPYIGPRSQLLMLRATKSCLYI